MKSQPIKVNLTQLLTPLLSLVFIFVFGCSNDIPIQDSPTNTQVSEDEVVLDSVIQLDNGIIKLGIEQYGGHYTDFQLASNPLNPLTWGVTSEQMPSNNKDGAPFKGHFLCLGRWGSPSEAEIEAGIPHNGEQSNTLWEIKKLDKTSVSMENDAPLDGLKVEREIQLVDNEAVFVVKETFTNTYSLGRTNNVVQHVTIGPPFLSKETLVNTNATKGFNQKFSYPNPHAFEYTWPTAIADTSTLEKIDLQSTSKDQNYVSTHIFDANEKYGWITAYNPTEGLILGYVWNLEEYPWLNVWNHFEEGEPFAKGLEFGTTGIGQPYQKLLETDTRFHDYNSWEYINAGETKEKSFLGFMIQWEKESENPTLSVDSEQIKINDKAVLVNHLSKS